MKFEPIKVQLKNGQKVEIRQGQVEDADNMLVFMKETFRNTEFLLVDEDEFNMTVEQETAWLKNFDANPTSLFLVATYENMIIGNIGIHGNNYRKMKHTASLGISLSKQWQGVGLGSIMMKEAIKWVKEQTLLKFLWIEVYSANRVAFAMYIKLGFMEVGRMKGYIKLSGGYCDKILMSLNLSYYICL